MRLIRHVIEHVECNHIILLDEDAFVFDYPRMLDLLRWSIRNEARCVGMPDGGIVKIRRFNPNAMNTFFNILDLAHLRSKWDPEACRSYSRFGHTMTQPWPPGEMLNAEWCRYVDFEPYYCFYFWLKSTGSELRWLSAATHSDGVSTLLNDVTDQHFLIHTWYARNFSRDATQRLRILDAQRWAAARARRRAVAPATVRRMTLPIKS